MNKKFVKLLCMILSSFVILSLAGCSNQKRSEYKEFMYEFYDYYFEVADSLDLYDITNMIEGLQSSKNQDNLKAMEKLLSGIKDKVPEKREEHYGDMCNWYNALVNISNAYGKWDSLSTDVRGDLELEMTKMSMRQTNWHDKDSGIGWEW